MALTNERAHELAREHGASRVVYALVRSLAVPFMRLWWGLRITDGDKIPPDGAAIVVPNHKSFWDSFFVAAATRRHVRFMGKSELFEGPWGRMLVALGAFPVRRGQSDADALETARTILRQGGLLAMFPEGTRVRDPDELGEPRKGAGRLALETGAVLVPAGITGTERLFLAGVPKPAAVRLAFSEPIEAADLPATPEAAGELVEERVWPEVRGRFDQVRRHPGVIAATLAALGLGGGLALRARKKPKSGLPWRR